MKNYKELCLIAKVAVLAGTVSGGLIVVLSVYEIIVTNL